MRVQQPGMPVQESYDEKSNPLLERYNSSKSAS